MTTHEAGWAHAAGALDGPSWLRVPDDVNALHPLLWSGTSRRTDDGGVEVGGVDLRDLLAEHNSPAYVLDEADFRQRAQAFRDAFKDYDVFYAGKAFLCTSVARWVQEEGIDLILLDINMPVMNGLEFLQRVQKEPAYQAIPVIIISTEGKEEDTIRGLKMGAKGYVKKPFQASELHGLIEKITTS